jgi:protein disulfide-isomerase
MLFFTGSDWCGWCIRLQREVFQKPEFEPWAKENVVLVDLDFPSKKKQDPKIKEQNQKLQKQFGIRGYPTVVFVTPVKENKSYKLIEIGAGQGRTGYMKGGPKVWCSDASMKLSGSGK